MRAKITKVLLWCLLALGCLSCGSENVPVSELKVTDGKLDTHNVSVHHGVVTIETKGRVNKDGRQSTGRCSGSFVNDSVLLTSAHCLIDQKQVNYLDIKQGRYTSYTKISFKKYYLHPKFKECTAEKDICPKYDIGVVIFPKNTYKGKPVKIKTDLAKKGDEIMLLGYGGNKDSLSLKKYYGYNKIARIGKGTIWIEADFNRSPKESWSAALAERGDSGSPMLSSDTKEMVGILSTSTADSKDKDKDKEKVVHFSSATAIHSEHIITFLESISRNEKIEIPMISQVKYVDAETEILVAKER